MKAAMPNKRADGRPRFKTKLVDDKAKSKITGLPYGDCVPVLDLGERHKLQKYLPKELLGLPLNFQQTADLLLWQKRQLSHPRDLLKKLDYYEQLHDASPYPYWETLELPPELLREALSQCAENALNDYAVVRQALARLYSVAWHGRGAEAVAARSQLMQLLPQVPKGRIPDPITKHLPEIAEKFRELRGSIRESDNFMEKAHPKWKPERRWFKLAEAYGEGEDVIKAALRKEERPFIEERLATVLKIPLDTVRKGSRKVW